MSCSPHRPSFLRVGICRLFVLAAVAVAAGSSVAAPTEPLRLKFSDFFVQPIGPAGLVPTPQLQQAQGREVTLVGWMVAQEDAVPGYFLFTARPVRMSEHADGDADDLPGNTVLVRLPASHAAMAAPHQPGLIELTGTLHYGREVEPDGRVSWVQLQLPAR